MNKTLPLTTVAVGIVKNKQAMSWTADFLFAIGDEGVNVAYGLTNFVNLA